MTPANWDWSDIVNLDLVERAIAAQERRATRRSQERAARDDTLDDQRNEKPVTA